MNSTMKNKPLTILIKIGVAAFWVLIWQLVSMLVDNSYFVPTVPETAVRLGEIVFSLSFLKIVFSTLLRVGAGYLIGAVVAIVLSFVCYKLPCINSLFSPIITVIKSTPVASFVIILWVLMTGNSLVVFVSFLMVMPVFWQNLIDGYSSIDKGLLEVADVFEFSRKKRARLVVFPALIKYFVPASITSIGLAWKATIAAEIIAYTKDSIGEQINNSKAAYDDTEGVFAWTVIIICFSIALEWLIKFLLSKFKKEEVMA